jgi:hypothetical protein
LYEQVKTLYEAWDNVMWMDALSWNTVGDGCRMAMFTEDMGEIVGAFVSNEGPPDSIEIPEIWYPEKYLTSRKQEARAMQEHWCATKRALYRSQQLEFEYTKWVDPMGEKVIDRREMLRKIIDQYSKNMEFLNQQARLRELDLDLEKLVDFDADKFPAFDKMPFTRTDEEERLSKGCEHVVKRCEYLLSKIEHKMKSKGSWIAG